MLTYPSPTRAEYFARYNLGHDVPFENYTNGIVYWSQVSNSSRGATRPAWELLYSHYVQVKGRDAPWTTEYLNYTITGYGGFEPGAGTWGEGSGHYDGLGWGSLLYHMDDDDVAAVANDVAASSTSSITAAALTKVHVAAFNTSAAATSSTLAVSTATIKPTCRSR